MKSVGFGASFVCCLFVVFTLVMFVDQVKMKYEDTSTIDKMQVSRYNAVDEVSNP
jgi:hypothetical protein